MLFFCQGSTSVSNDQIPPVLGQAKVPFGDLCSKTQNQWNKLSVLKLSVFQKYLHQQS